MAFNNKHTHHFVTFVKTMRNFSNFSIEVQYCPICSYFYYYNIIINMYVNMLFFLNYKFDFAISPISLLYFILIYT